MKITLLMPHGKIHRKGGIFGRWLRYAPLTLTTLAALIPADLNAEITLIDEGVETLDPASITADLVGITCLTGISRHAYEISAQLRARGITTVLGGIHPTLMPDEAQEHADAIVVGFAEYTWPQLLRDFVAGKLQPRYVQGHDFVFMNMPEPRRDLLKPNSYITMNTVQATRGCLKQCDFCVVPRAWPGFLTRPVREVIEEIERLPGKKFLFLDLSPIEDPSYIKQLYRELIPLKKTWGGLATMEIARDDEMLSLASKSGCRGLLLGIESVTAETIKSMGKGRLNNPQNYYAEIKKLHDAGIAINGCFVFGHDGDDSDVFQRTVEFIDRAAIDLPRFALATPFPNTALHRKLKREGRLLHEDWSYYDTQHVVFRPARMSPDKLLEGHLWAWKEAYRLPMVARRLLRSGASRSAVVLQHTIPTNLTYRFFSQFLPEFALTTCEAEPDFALTN
jgi:radical SAM superfamily enzyme YgiQ (UPF0313 family)